MDDEMTFDEWLDEQIKLATWEALHGDEDIYRANLLKLVRAQRELLALPDDYGGLSHERRLSITLADEIAALEAALIGVSK